MSTTMRRSLLWAGFVVVLVLKLWLIGDKGTGDMDVALGWGRDLLDRGLIDGYTGSNFPVAFQIYEGVVWVAREIGMKGYAAMKWTNLLCDVAVFFLLRTTLRRWGASPDWAFLYWISPYFLVMFWLGYDHFQMTALLLATLMLIDRASTLRGYLLASIPLGIGFVQRPQVEACIAVLAIYVALLALERLKRREGLVRSVWNEETRPALALLVGPVVLFGLYSLWFFVHGEDLFRLTRAYLEIPAYSPALSANMLNVWAAVGEAYRRPGETLPAVHDPAIYHSIAGLLGLGALVAGTWLIVRTRATRPFGRTAFLLFALGAIVLPNIYTRAHDNHFFLGAVMVIPLLAVLARRERRLALAVLVPYLVLNAWNSFSLYGFGQISVSTAQPFLWIRSQFTDEFRLGASVFCAALFLALMVTLRPVLERTRTISR
jgi:hypothetical protein